jgi:hypothetical protein
MLPSAKWEKAMQPAKKLVGVVALVVATALIVWHFSKSSAADAVMAAPKPGTGIANAAGAAEAGPHIAGCPIFPADNVWNTPIDSLKKDKRSDDYVQHVGSARSLHPNFGSAPENGVPVTIIKPNRPFVPISFMYGDESDLGHYPTPEGALIEGGWNSPADSDRHVIMIDEGRCMLYELGNVAKGKDGWAAGAGIKMDLTSNALRAEGKTSTDAAGLAILPGLLRYDEIAAGEIRHAIRFTAPKTQRAYVWPARHFASKITDPAYPPMGQRFRLRADYDISKFSKENQVILKGLKRYGMILSDNGSPWFIIGEPDKRWSDDDLSNLKTVTGDNFEAVDESDWQMHADSGRVDPISLR